MGLFYLNFFFFFGIPLFAKRKLFEGLCGGNINHVKDKNFGGKQGEEGGGHPSREGNNKPEKTKLRHKQDLKLQCLEGVGLRDVFCFYLVWVDLGKGFVGGRWGIYKGVRGVGWGWYGWV